LREAAAEANRPFTRVTAPLPGWIDVLGANGWIEGIE
jgi:hypothetical protein